MFDGLKRLFYSQDELDIMEGGEKPSFFQTIASLFGYHGSQADLEHGMQEWEEYSSDPSNHIDDQDYLDRY